MIEITSFTATNAQPKPSLNQGSSEALMSQLQQPPTAHDSSGTQVTSETQLPTSNGALTETALNPDSSSVALSLAIAEAYQQQGATSELTTKVSPSWGSIGSYQVEKSLTSQVHTPTALTPEKHAIKANQTVAPTQINSAAQTSNHRETVTSGAQSAQLNGTQKAKALQRQTQLLGNLSRYLQAAELIPQRRWQLIEQQGEKTLRVRDYFSDQSGPTNTEQLASSGISKLVINGITQWEKK